VSVSCRLAGGNLCCTAGRYPGDAENSPIWAVAPALVSLALPDDLAAERCSGFLEMDICSGHPRTGLSRVAYTVVNGTKRPKRRGWAQRNSACATGGADRLQSDRTPRHMSGLNLGNHQTYSVSSSFDCCSTASEWRRCGAPHPWRRCRGGPALAADDTTS
jgi:hypothetical protein